MMQGSIPGKGKRFLSSKMSRQATCLHGVHRENVTFIIKLASVMKVLSKQKILQNKMQTTELCYLPLDKDKSWRYHVQWQPLLEGGSHFFLRRLAFRHNVGHHKLITTLIAFHHNTASADHVELQQCCLYSLQRVPSDHQSVSHINASNVWHTTCEAL